MNFAFISRSGADKPEAAQVIDRIKKAGASTQVFRADATNETDVSEVISTVSATRPIRGVVHAAMVLHVSPPNPYMTDGTDFVAGRHVRRDDLREVCSSSKP